MSHPALFSCILRLPLESLDCVAYERSTEKRAELFGCLQPGSLPGATGWKNHRHREVHAALPRVVAAHPGLAAWEKPGIGRPVRVAVFLLHGLHQVFGARPRQVGLLRFVRWHPHVSPK